jgi:hypothetical protein
MCLQIFPVGVWGGSLPILAVTGVRRGLSAERYLGDLLVTMNCLVVLNVPRSFSSPNASKNLQKDFGAWCGKNNNLSKEAMNLKI